MPFLFGIFIVFASFQEKKHPYQCSFTIFRLRGPFIFTLQFLRTRFLPLPSPPTSTLHPSPDRHGVQRHRHTFCAEEFCRPGWWQSKLAVNRSWPKIARDLCFLLGVRSFFSLRFELSSLYLCIHLCIWRFSVFHMASKRWQSLLGWPKAKHWFVHNWRWYDNIINLHVMVSISMR